MDTDTGEIKSNDNMEIFLVNIDQPAYNFFKEAEDVAYNNDNLSAPATPGSNITGGCIGYFSAQTVSHQPVRIK
jgi:hypothetical protein